MLKYNKLETPCIIIDMNKVSANIQKMQAAADYLRCKLRPHAKTHKSVEIAKMQIGAGSCGITCAKPSEAEVFEDNGIDDIFIAYPLIGANKLRRALNIQKKIKRLIVAVDSIEGAKAMSDFAVSENAVFEVRLEIDTGASRTGAMIDNLCKIGAEIKELPGINVTGVYTFKSLVYKNLATTDAEAAGGEEARLIAEAADVLRGTGLNINDISCGSTPTGLTSAKTGFVNEIRPGTYVFYDWLTLIEGCCDENDIAAYLYATVISTPQDSLAVIDAGTKALSTDIRLNVPPFSINGYAKISGNDDLVLDRLNEEHGMIRHINGGKTGLCVGDVLRLIPAHICTAINLHDFIYADENGVLRKMNIDARGKVY